MENVMFYTNFFTYKNKVYVRGYENGKRFSKKIPYNPYLFTCSKNKKSSYKDIYGKNFDRIDFASINEAKEFIDNYSNVADFEIGGLHRFEYVYINDNFSNNLNDIVNLNNIKIVNFDIEVLVNNEGFPDPSIAKQPITTITANVNEKYFLFGTGEYKPSSKNIIYIRCLDEKDLLCKFVNFIEKMDPDIYTGWNIEFFDIPYLMNRMKNLDMMNEYNRMSPFGIVYSKKTNYKNKMVETYELKGVSILDYLKLVSKFSFRNFEDYKLNTIAYELLGEKKVDFSEYSNLDELYHSDFQKFCDYNIKDVELVKKLDEKQGFIFQILTMSYDAKVNYNDAFTTVLYWDVIIHNYLMKKNIVVTGSKDKKERPIVGGYVKDSIPGIYEWVCSFDVSSLYPHIMMQFNISPETYVGKISSIYDMEYPVDFFLSLESNDEKYKNLQNGLKSKNICVTGLGTCFTNEKEGFLSELMQIYFDRRSKYRKLLYEEMKLKEKEKDPEKIREHEYKISKYHNKQLSAKISINAAYGMLSNRYCRWYSADLAESITMSGQLIIQYIAKNINKHMNDLCKTNDIDYTVLMDTDSFFLECKNLLDPSLNFDEKIEFLDNFSKNNLDCKIQQICENFAKMMNTRVQKLKMKREKISSQMIIVAGKKRYALNLVDEEGVRYDVPQIKMTGIEAVRSSTPEICRKAIKELIQIIMNETEEKAQEYIENFKEQFMKMPFEKIAFPRSANNLNEFLMNDGVSFKKSTPIHIRASINFNRIMKQNKLNKKYNLISSGDKIKFCYMKMPNPMMQDIFAVLEFLPKELKFEEYIDYEKQFEKAFIDPIKPLMSTKNWNTKKIDTLESFFG